MKPLSYAMVLNDLTPEVVHKYVGQEPSGKSFNELTLDYQRKFLNKQALIKLIFVQENLKTSNLNFSKFLRIQNKFGSH